MDFGFDYPDDWVGIPDVGDGHDFPTHRAWAEAVGDHLAPQLGILPKKRARNRDALVDALTVIADGLAVEGAHGGYIWFESLLGPYRFVALYGMDRAEIGDATGASLAGADGRDDYVPPIVREFVSDSGATGVYVESHAPIDRESIGVATISGSFAFEHPDAVVLLQSSTTDLAGYEQFRPHYERFARSFSWGTGEPS